VQTLDLIVLAAAAAAVVGGWRIGLLARAASWVGMAAGLWLAIRLLPTVTDALGGADPSNRLLVVAGMLVGGAFLGQAAGLLVGAQFHRVLPLGPLRLVDRALGAVAGVVGVLAAVWLLLPPLEATAGWPADQARDSVVARVLRDELPPPPNTLEALGRLVGGVLPEVFSAQPPETAPGPPPADSGLDPAVVARVRASTVKVSGPACARIQEGSGFAVAPDLVATNAHVVAGMRRTDVLRPDGRRLRATVVAFDPDRDLALLAVPGLGQAPLPVGDGRVGETGAVFGHPGGQDQVQVSPAAITREVEAVGRDLYDTHDTRRRVYVLAANLHPGDSGGALVNRTGVVVGVAFAIAPDNPDTAYALTSAELRAVLARPRSGAVPTGPCLAA
jgi:S1-C subfamily serine protease